MRTGIMGGTGFYSIFDDPEIIRMETPYGQVDVHRAKVGASEVFFLPRHDKDHRLPPHRINYRANVCALSLCRTDRIVAVNTVGSMNRGIPVGDLVVPHDFIDLTLPAPTFHDDGAFHVDMSDPLCPEIRAALISSASASHGKAHVHDGVYAATHGPRLETPAEIRMLSAHADVVGMTMAPECILAREKGICYASLCLVANMAAGLQKKLSAREITSNMSYFRDSAGKMILDAVKAIPADRNCGCRDAFLNARL
ncbi:MAG: S-methyl-5'-thioinosine phosphorylase [Thermoplasmata archaeon HGW-Thermoplasmata-1]|nr:MAG: S-methyl-5'-thioinosine phosphorylase [Thermoplasmata archaeon HGW-Thermoplasmata-1]